MIRTDPALAGFRLLVLLAVSLAILPATAVRASGGPPTPSDPSDPSTLEDPGPPGDGGLLSGPEVEEMEEPDDASRPPTATFGGSDRRRQQVTMRTWLRHLMELELDDTQRRAAFAVVAELKEVQDRFNEEYGDRMQELRREIRSAREREDEMTGLADLVLLRREMVKLTQQAPNIEAYKERIWDLLEADQQEAFRVIIEEAERARGDRRRDGDSMESMQGAERDRSSDRRSRSPLDERGRRRLEFLRARQFHAPFSSGRRDAPPRRRDSPPGFSSTD